MSGGRQNRNGTKAQIYPRDSRFLPSFHPSILTCQLVFMLVTSWLQDGCTYDHHDYIPGREKRNREVKRQSQKSPAYFFFHCLELVHILIPSHKEIGKVSIFSLVHCSSKQYQSYVQWKQGENRHSIGNRQPLPPMVLCQTLAKP